MDDSQTEAVATHTINLLRVSAGLQTEAVAALTDLQGELTAKLANAEGLSPNRLTRLEALLKQTDASIAAAYETIGANQVAALGKLAKVEGKTAQNLVNATIGAPVVSVIIPEKVLEAAVSPVIFGHTSADHWKGQSDDMRSKFAGAMRQGVLLGESVDELTTRLTGTKSANFADGLMPMKKRQAEALVRSSVIAVANEARLRQFAAMGDVVKGIQWVATLDSRTTPQCRALDGLMWRLPDFKPVGHDKAFPGPTAHWNCRSTQIAVPASWEELSGKELPSVPGGDVEKRMKEILAKNGMPEDRIKAAVADSRASMDGQVAKSKTFDDWLATKSDAFIENLLGPGRAKLWKNGDVTLQQMTDQNNRPLTLEELEKIVATGKAGPETLGRNFLPIVSEPVKLSNKVTAELNTKAKAEIDAILAAPETAPEKAAWLKKLADADPTMAPKDLLANATQKALEELGAKAKAKALLGIKKKLAKGDSLTEAEKLTVGELTAEEAAAFNDAVDDAKAAAAAKGAKLVAKAKAKMLESVATEFDQFKVNLTKAETEALQALTLDEKVALGTEVQAALSAAITNAKADLTAGLLAGKGIPADSKVWGKLTLTEQIEVQNSAKLQIESWAKQAAEDMAAAYHVGAIDDGNAIFDGLPKAVQDAAVPLINPAADALKAKAVSKALDNLANGKKPIDENELYQFAADPDLITNEVKAKHAVYLSELADASFIGSLTGTPDKAATTKISKLSAGDILVVQEQVNTKLAAMAPAAKPAPPEPDFVTSVVGPSTLEMTKPKIAKLAEGLPSAGVTWLYDDGKVVGAGIVATPKPGLVTIMANGATAQAQNALIKALAMDAKFAGSPGGKVVVSTMTKFPVVGEGKGKNAIVATTFDYGADFDAYVASIGTNTGPLPSATPTTAPTANPKATPAAVAKALAELDKMPSWAGLKVENVTLDYVVESFDDVPDDVIDASFNPDVSATLPKTTLPLSALKSLAPYVEKPKAIAAINGDLANTPVVVFKDGQGYIVTGDPEVLAAHLTGKKKLPVKVYNLDGDNSTAWVKSLKGALATPGAPDPPPVTPPTIANPLATVPAIASMTFKTTLPGSTRPSLYEDATGRQWVVKEAKSVAVAHLINEATADALYRAAGADTPLSKIVVEGGKTFKVAEFVPGAVSLGSLTGSARDAAFAALRENFVLDALLGNWDVAGLSFDNVIVKDGKPLRIDNGGALLYRAQGAKKAAEWLTADVKELESLRDKATNPQTAAIFGSLTKAEILDQIARLVEKRPDIVRALDASNADPETRDYVLKRLDALEKKLPKKKPGKKAASAAFDAVPADLPQIAQKAGSAGWSYLGDADLIEDNQVLMWRETDASGAPVTAVRLKVTDAGERKIRERLATLKVTKTATASASGAAPAADPFSIVTAAAKTVNHHVATKSTAYNPMKMQALDTLAATLKADAKSPDPAKSLPAKHFLALIDAVKAGAAANTAVAFPTDYVPSPAEKKKMDAYAKKQAKTPPAPPAAAPSDWIVKDTGAWTPKLKRRNADGTLTELPQVNVTSSVGEYYVFEKPGITVEFQPRRPGASSRAGRVNEGGVHVRIDGDLTPAMVAEVVSTLADLGIDAGPATDEYKELLYLHRTAFLRREETNGEYARLWSSSEPVAVKLEKIKAWAEKQWGVKLPRGGRAEWGPDYNPDGVAQGLDGSGFRVWYRADVPAAVWEKEMKGKVLLHASKAPLKAVEGWLSNNGIATPTYERLRTGISIAQTGGASPTADIMTSGAQYLFTNITDRTVAKKLQGFVFKIDAARRADLVSVDDDLFGDAKANQYRRLSAVADLKKLKRTGVSADTGILKNGLNFVDSLESIDFGTAVNRQIRDTFHRFGIFTLPDGRKVEDLFPSL